MIIDPKTRAQFELWAQRHGYDVSMHCGRYSRAVVRAMAEAWSHQSEQVAGLAEQNGRLMKQLAEARNTIARQKQELHALDARRDAAMRLAGSLAEAVDVGIDAAAIEIHGD